MNKLIKIILITIALISSFESFSQTEDKDYALINVYRLKESMMSGGRALSIMLYINDQEVSAILTNTKLTYKLYSTGDVKIKCVAEFGGSGIGSPYVENFKFEKGKEYHISIAAKSMIGVKGGIADKKKMKKINKNKFADTIVLEEKL